MNRIKKFALPVLILAAAIVAFAAMTSMNPRPERRPPEAATLVVDAIRPVESRDRFMIDAQGTVQAKNETTIVSEVSGPIVSLSEDFVAGGLFEAGTELARIDPSDYEAALLSAEADLAAARASLSNEQARSDAARDDFRRLYGDSREPSALTLRLPQLAQASAAVQAREAAVMRARRDLERTRIRLPYDGMVTRRDADLGQFVSAGTTLGVAFATDRAEVRLPMSDRDLSFLDLPPTASRDGLERPVMLRATVAGQPGEWPAKLVRTEGVVDRTTRLTYLVVEIEDPYALDDDGPMRALPVGTYVDAVIPGRDARGLVIVPPEAVHSGDQVYLANADDELEVRTVDIVRQTTDRIYIDNAITPDDRVVTTAIPAPVPGLKLRVRETGGPQLKLLPAEEELATAEARDAP